MRRRLGSLIALSVTGVLAGSLLVVPPAGAAPPAPPPEDRMEVYTGLVGGDQLEEILDLGVDRHDVEVTRAPAGRSEGAEKSQVRVEAILSSDQARRLEDRGVELEPKRIDGLTVTQRATLAEENGYEVWRTYAGRNGLKREFQVLAQRNQQIAKLVTLGQTLNGEDLVALKVTRNARRTVDGRRPAVVYLSAQHAREWITPEMTRRLANYVIDGYYEDRSIRRLLSTTELWFVPVANPDGYDFTFEPGQRLWRKNLRDNNADGQIAPGDGVDLNRNWPTKWGYDNEGSSPNPASETYRGAGPASEPETVVLDDFIERISPEFLVNYHSAAELLLYGTGWQVATPTPDDVIYETMAGDDEDPAVPGYDPDISAELYTTNGDTDTDLTERHGVLGFTPEMSTCAAAAQSVPDDEWVDTECGSGFEFPDDEELVQAEFEKNIPFAMSVAESAADPDDPSSVVGRDAPDFVLDTFEVSYGDPQTVGVVAKRALRGLEMNYRIDGGRVRTVSAPEWAGGERYGDENDDYYAEYRGQVRFAEPGDRVQVWFSGRLPGQGFVSSNRFTYRVAADTGSDVLVIANEDYTGVNPTYPAGTTGPKYADAHVAAVEAAGYTADVWDVDTQGVPHDLAVLSHYDAVLWYLGDNRITQDPEDELTTTPFGDLADVSVAERQQYLTLAVRDYLNAGGKLLHAGETAQYQGLAGISTSVGGLYYGLNGAPEEECVVSPRPDGSSDGFFEDCLILADDFRQYYLGAFGRRDLADPASVAGTEDPLTGFSAELGGPVVEGANPLDEAGVWTPTSDELPVGEFPQFASSGVAEYPSVQGSPYAPIEGDRFARVLHEDASYARLTRTVTVPTGASAELDFQLSYSVEPGYDQVIVEARPAGSEEWTTLPEVGGATSSEPPAECTTNPFLLALHPFLVSYLGADCTPPGTTGDWNALSGDSGGWSQVGYDLSGFAGGDVEVSISYVSDPNSGEIGVFVDDTHVVVDGVDDADGFEDAAASDWTIGTAPTGSPTSAAAWELGAEAATNYAATATDDTLLLGFGLEQLTSDEERADLVGRALDDLID
ncbi:M14 family metallopeptidase [Nocardioides insulae]|uniref:M14 family metallopeptidase n=1 Tax=Nocardioides insulae TaxID=394734 RepID=UPI00042983CE|nr:M14 family metallopeptidase [Nocardioides insulae]